MSAAIDDDPWVGDPKPKPTPFWRRPRTWIALGCSVVVLHFVLILVAVLMYGSKVDERVSDRPVPSLPRAVSSGVAVRGADLDSEVMAALHEEGLLDAGEQPLYAYMDDPQRARDSGVFFTKRELVSYERPATGGELVIVRAPYVDIEGLEFTRATHAQGYSRIEVTTRDGFFRVLVSPRDGGDVEFESLLRKTWGTQRSGR